MRLFSILLNIDGLRPFATRAFFRLKRKARAFRNRAQTGSFQGGNVNENILGAIIGSDKSESAIRIEEF